MLSFINRDQVRSERGQVGVIILLTMAGMLTVGLSLASRVTQESLLSSKETQSTRVFNAAEEGVEEALSGDFNFAGDSSQGSFEVEGIAVNYSVTKVNRLETRFFEGVSVGVDVTRDAPTASDNLQIDWSQGDNCNVESLASLIISVYYDDAGTTRVRYYPVGACDYNDGFTPATTINNDGYHRRYDLNLEQNDFLVRIKPVYADTQVKISGSNFELPVQYYSVRSAAANTEGNESRTIEVNRTLATSPSILDYTVLSGDDIVK